MMTEEQKIRRREYLKAYAAKNREKIRAHQKVYRTAHPLKKVWAAMMQRCGLHKGASAEVLAQYAGRGITVCQDWHHFPSFEKWALASGWKPGLQIDRIDNNGNYSPENCRFVTPSQNMLNRRITVLAAGIPLKTWYDAYKSKMVELGLTYAVVKERFTKLGWTLEASLFTPVKRRSA